MVAIGVHQSLSNSVIYEHRCLVNMKELYKYAGKCDNKRQYKSMMDLSTVSKPELLTDNSTITVGIYSKQKQPNAKSYLVMFWQYWM